MISLIAIDIDMSSRRQISKFESAIYIVRGHRVMLDSDLAAIYQVTTKKLNQQLRRTRDRFPKDFAFQLSAEELTILRSQSVTSRLHGGRRYRPWVFTEHGAIMLASVLNSDIAVQASLRVVRTFVRLREMVAANVQLAAKLADLEHRLDSHNEAIVDLFAALKRLLEPSEPKKKREIGFHVREKQARYRTNNLKKA
jgi:hypothetical protein